MRKLFGTQPVGGNLPKIPTKEEEEKEALLFKAIEIHSVSNDPMQTGGPVKSSLEGGSELYLKGQGFGKDMTELEVLVGGEECELVESSEVMVKCRTKNVMLD